MRHPIWVLMTIALMFTGCRTTEVTAIPEPQSRFSDPATVMWRLRLDGVAYVLTGELPGNATDVKKPTPFFLIPEPAYDSKTLVLHLENDGYSVRVGGVAFAGPGEVTVSEPRIFRFVPTTDRKWNLKAISAPFPPNVARADMLSILSACLNRKIVERTAPRA